MLRFIPLGEDGALDLSTLDGLLTERTKIVAVTGMSNVLGTLTPIRALADAAHAVGAVILVDGAQLVPHHPVDVAALDVDFLTISGHKMLGPTASGGLYGRREVLERMEPFLGGGEMILEVYPDHSTFKEIPFKFEAGTMNIAEEIGLAAAVDYLTDLGMDAVREHEKRAHRVRARGAGRRRREGVRPGRRRQPRGRHLVLDRGRPPARRGADPGHRGRVRAGRSPLRAAADADPGRPRHRPGVVLVYNSTDDVDALVRGLDRVRAVFA